MKNTLFSWLGFTDIKASQGETGIGLGPIAQALQSLEFENVILLSDHSNQINQNYLKWISKISQIPVNIQKVKLTGPTQFGEIYEKVTQAVSDFQKAHKDERPLTFHISPGTPAMAAVWIILSKTRFPAEIIESSIEKGIKTVSVPFDISADYIPDLLKKPDKDLIRMSQGLPEEAPEFESVIHRCDAMKKLILRARRVAPRNIPVLLQGESGTGKELIARAIHQSSARKENPFIAVNCGAIPNELVEAEFFGFEKGAFTGATSPKPGYVESANGGTLFLDEIGDLPLNAQVKLLRVIQENQVTRLGSIKHQKIVLRVVSATNKNLLEEVAKGLFREDLFHRLAVEILDVPPLRDRENDLGLLIDNLITQINAELADQPGFKSKKISISAKNFAKKYPWPGNVRELKNTLLRASIRSGGSTISLEDMEDALLQFPRKEGTDILCHPIGNGFKIQSVMDTVVRHYLERALKESGGNKSKAAGLLGIPNHQTLSNWMKKYNVTE